jgi:hypothetical protein
VLGAGTRPARRERRDEVRGQPGAEQGLACPARGLAGAALRDMASSCCGEKVENPVRCLAARLWKLVDLLPRHDQTPEWEIAPAEYVQARDEQNISGAEYGRMYGEDQQG